MPQRKKRLSREEQRKRFEEEVQKRIDAGELSPTDADDKLDALVRKSIKDHGP